MYVVCLASGLSNATLFSSAQSLSSVEYRKTVLKLSLLPDTHLSVSFGYFRFTDSAYSSRIRFLSSSSSTLGLSCRSWYNASILLSSSFLRAPGGWKTNLLKKRSKNVENNSIENTPRLASCAPGHRFIVSYYFYVLINGGHGNVVLIMDLPYTHFPINIWAC